MTPIYRHACSVITISALCFSSLVQAAPVSGQGTWETTLQGRDLDGNAATGEAYYDTTLNITWLADANAAGSVMTWSAANSWANTLSVNGNSGWRLPTMTDVGNDGCNFSSSGGTDCGYNVQTGTSEMAHMFYVTLGDKSSCPPGNASCISAGVPQPGWGLTNTGPFANLQGYFYWINLADATRSGSHAWDFSFFSGNQGANDQGGSNFYAWAVHDGDVVAPVPLPAAAWLFGSGLLGLFGVTRKRRSRADLVPAI